MIGLAHLNSKFQGFMRSYAKLPEFNVVVRSSDFTGPDDILYIQPTHREGL